MRTPLTIIALAALIGGIFLIGFLIGTSNTLPAPQNPPAPPVEGRVITNKIVAVDDAGKGVVAELVTTIRQGTGLVLVNINDVLADLNAQYSARTATKVASDYTNLALDTVDVIFTIHTNPPVGVVGGQSAGSSMAVSLIAGLLNKTLNHDVILTGSLLENGTLGEAGALREKAEAARTSNASLFLIPAGSGSIIRGYAKEKQCSSREGYEECSLRYVSQDINLGEVAGLEVKEVATIAEAVAYYLT